MEVRPTTLPRPDALVFIAAVGVSRATPRASAR